MQKRNVLLILYPPTFASHLCNVKPECGHGHNGHVTFSFTDYFWAFTSAVITTACLTLSLLDQHVCTTTTLAV